MNGNSLSIEQRSKLGFDRATRQLHVSPEEFCWYQEAAMWDEGHWLPKWLMANFGEPFGIGELRLVVDWERP